MNDKKLLGVLVFLNIIWLIFWVYVGYQFGALNSFKETRDYYVSRITQPKRFKVETSLYRCNKVLNNAEMYNEE